MPKTLESPELEHLYKISQIVLHSTDWKEALDEVTYLVRSLLIFDNLVVYLKRGDDVLDVMYAKAMGRGKSAEADIAWGEDLANHILQDQEMMLQEPIPDPTKERIEQPFLLGIPLFVGKNILGVFLLIRFGGPNFKGQHVHLAKYIAQQIATLIDRQDHLRIEKILADQDKQIQLQNDFISTISHELRSPLGFIKGYTTTLLRDDTSWDQDTQHEFLQIIDQETDHLQQLIDNLLDSSRLQAGLLKMKHQHVRLDTLVKDVLAREKMHHPDLEAEIVIKTDLEPIWGDPYRLAQVIENLVSNAVKYAAGSKIWVTINQEKNQTRIDVADEGPGIPETYLGHIFERFFRSPDQSPNVHGSGLGLFICKQIIEAHEGTIFAESQVGKGTTIKIHLPRQSETVQE